MKLKLYLPVIAIFFNGFGDTIKRAPHNWYNSDAGINKVRGVSTEKTYNLLLQNKNSKTIIVAILDTGIDIEHEDLKDNIWVNGNEIAGNGIDDDKNGYIDDIHGWNFIGGKDGSHVIFDTKEITRMYKACKDKFEFKDRESLSLEEKNEYERYLEIKKIYNKEFKNIKSTYNRRKRVFEKYNQNEKIINNYLKTADWTIRQIKKIRSEDENVINAKQFLLRHINKGITKKNLEASLEIYERMVNFYYNPDHDPRHIIGDNYYNITERYYGNNSVKGPNSSHGTLVAGIICAERNNSIGINGIADNVEIMVLKTVPLGDERDKDIANSIYYAVDNGAKIINMSFGKKFSPYKEYVDEAIKHAERNNVLIVHAAGNDGIDNDQTRFFPHRQYLNSEDECKTWIEAGASSWRMNHNFVGVFSNYGKESVDLFAPGVDIYSTAPEQNYERTSGTSMSAPVVTGVAALVWSYFPELDAKQLKSILIESVEYYGDETVKYPGRQNKPVRFSKLSKSGGIVNAYNAIKMAENMIN